MGKTIHERWLEWVDVEPSPGCGKRQPAVRVPRPLTGTAFFPGGYGLWDAPNPTAPDTTLQRRVMIVLNNFGNEAWFEECQRNGDAEIVNASTGTWPGLIQLLTTVPIDRRDCYFTNAYVGLLKGDEDLLRDLPGTRRDAHFRQACEASLHQQLALVRPKLVLPMGGRAVALLGRASPSLRKWVGPRFGERQFNEIDRDGAAYVRQAAFPQVGLTCSAVALTHPSMRNQGGRNAVVDGHRRVGGDAEHAMIRTAMGLQSLT